MSKWICAGSFDPITLGHEDMIRRAAALCDRLTIGVIDNPQKQGMFTLEQRKEMVETAVADLDNVDVIEFSGLLVSFVKENGYDAIIRGLRNNKDFDYELELAQIYQSYKDYPCETVYLMTAPEYSFVSSTAARENFVLGSDISNFVSKKVARLMKRYKKQE